MFDFTDQRESQSEGLRRVLAGSPLLWLASELLSRVSRGFEDQAYAEAAQRAKLAGATIDWRTA